MPSAWAEVDAWLRKQTSLRFERALQLARLGWVMLPSDDGQFWARRFRAGDREDTLHFEGEPEATAPTFELLLVEIQLRVGRKAGAA